MRTIIVQTNVKRVVRYKFQERTFDTRVIILYRYLIVFNSVIGTRKLKSLYENKSRLYVNLDDNTSFDINLMIHFSFQFSTQFSRTKFTNFTGTLGHVPSIEYLFIARNFKFEQYNLPSNIIKMYTRWVYDQFSRI